MLLRLWDHLEWANEQVCAAIDPLDPKREEPLRRLLAHILGAEDIWMGRIRGDDRPVEVWPPWSVEECRERGERLLQEYRRVIEGASNEELTRPVSYETTSNEAYTTPLVDILLHVALHGAHHRGQIAARMRREGAEPAVTDFADYSRSLGH